jgi:hypothetical protein
MKCSACGKESSWLNYIGIDNICNKCIEKHTIFKEIRFSNDRRLMIALKKRKIKNFEDIKKITETDFENILLTDPNIGTYKPKTNKAKKGEDDDDDDIPLV